MKISYLALAWCLLFVVRMRSFSVRRTLLSLALLSALRLGGGSGVAAAKPLPWSPLDEPVSDAVGKAKFVSVLERVVAMKKSGGTPVFVFDIDDTLFRTPYFKPRLADPPVPGAIPYAKALDRAGATLVYLTGRFKSIMTKLTEEQFRRGGVPFGGRHQLLLNPTANDTLKWKRDAQKLIRGLGTPIAFIDNEFRNVRLFRDEYRKEPVDILRIKTRSLAPDPRPQLGADGIVVLAKYYPLEAKRSARAAARTCAPRAIGKR